MWKVRLLLAPNSFKVAWFGIISNKHIAHKKQFVTKCVTSKECDWHIACQHLPVSRQEGCNLNCELQN